MNLRKVTSLTALISFLLEVLTSVVLYIVPQGRVAYWSDWKLWGLTKTEWGNLHINLGVLFLVAIFLHIFYNLKPIMSYLKNRARQFKIFTSDFNAALIVTVIVALGTYFYLPPFSTVIDFGNNIKDQAARFYGEPPYGHAELSSLKTFAKKVNLDLNASMEKLRNSGIKVMSDEQTIKEVAAINLISPKQLYELMIPFESTMAHKTLPDEPPGGFGRRTIADICQEYDLNMKIVLRSLADAGYKTTEYAVLKDAAEEFGLDPHAFYEIFKKAATAE
ncbi:MAG: DUF4405 domain-containing protein [Desulfobulbaceae bacterium]|nr:DUF4405 domain-containing protein [Desulfobulbaceae bacterium]